MINLFKLGTVALAAMFAVMIVSCSDEGEKPIVAVEDITDVPAFILVDEALDLTTVGTVMPENATNRTGCLDD